MSPNEEINQFHHGVNAALQQVPTQYTVPMGDLNAKPEHKLDVSGTIHGIFKMPWI